MKDIQNIIWYYIREHVIDKTDKNVEDVIREEFRLKIRFELRHEFYGMGDLIGNHTKLMVHWKLRSYKL